MVLCVTSLLAAFGVQATAPSIRHMEHSGREFEEWITQQAVRFHEQTGIAVEVEFGGPAGKVPEKLAVRVAAGLAPDTTFMSLNLLPLTKVPLVDLRPFVDRDRLNLSRYPNPVISHLTVQEGLRQGAFLGLPVSLWTYGVAYNKGMSEQNGLPKPNHDWSWADLITYTRKLGADTSGDGTIDRWGLMLPVAWTRMGVVVHQAGGGWLDSQTDPKRATLANANTRLALDFIDDLFATGGADGGWEAFWRNRAGISYDAGPNYGERIAQQSNPFEFEWIPYAKRPGPNTGGELAVQFYAMLEDSRSKDAAWQWLKFLTHDMQSQLEYGARTQRIPAYLPASQRYFSDMSRANPSIMEIVTLVADPTSYVRPTSWEAVGDIIDTWLTRAYVQRDISLHEAIVQTERLIEGRLASLRTQGIQ
jgi:ABC-type glycerol-3-phosphate transport system substrate-binding protein